MLSSWFIWRINFCSWKIEAYEQTRFLYKNKLNLRQTQALQSILESAPAPKPVNELAQKILLKQSQRQASFDKAEITPMVDINSERIVLFLKDIFLM